MKLKMPLRLLAAARNLLVLFAAVTLFAPQSGHAGMGIDQDVAAVAVIMDEYSHHADVADALPMDHCAVDPCAEMICLYAMPITMDQGPMRPLVIRVGDTAPYMGNPGSIDPAMLRKPPKHA